MNFINKIIKNKIIIAGLALLVIAIAAGGAFLFLRNNPIGEQEVEMYDPVDVVLFFYQPWLNARISTSTDPYAEGLDKYPILSRELRKRLSKTKGQPEGEVDPVLCQTSVPTRISSRTLYESEDKSEILILAKDEGLDGQAVVTLNRLNDGWYIDQIRCAPGEFAPQREFSFEKEGYLLKSVLPPLDPQYWHLVFEENNQLGHVAPLYFSDESVCILSNGDEGVCDTSRFVEATKTTVYGEMNEYGVDVKKLEFSK